MVVVHRLGAYGRVTAVLASARGEKEYDGCYGSDVISRSHDLTSGGSDLWQRWTSELPSGDHAYLKCVQHNPVIQLTGRICDMKSAVNSPVTSPRATPAP
ncbi:hypothetical protein GCM10027590_08900 [Nocardiopsis nanhaiensis]